MKDIKILDCTLRDGGYINDWNFGQNNIKHIIEDLEKAKIDIIECGFIRNEEFNKDKSIFSSMQDLAKTIYPKKDGILYAIMIEQHNRVENLIPKYDGLAADIIRVTFRKKEWSEAKETVRKLIKKGYKVCVQPVGTVTYDDESLLNLIKDVNLLNPYAFYLVDTLGICYRHDMRKFFYFIDGNLSQNICLGFHSHNNLQMSFSNAQEMIRLTTHRKLIIDSSCYGMGRGVGNLATELFADYINNNIQQKYPLTPILNIVDKFLMPIYAKQKWGYDLPYFLSATYKCHPNFASYLLRKETLDIEGIEKILSLIPMNKRSEFDQHLISELYLQYQNCEIDDSDDLSKLSDFIGGRSVVIIGPGATILKYNKEINEIKKDKLAISTNFIPTNFEIDIVFISNAKRLANIGSLKNIGLVISTSNLNVPNSLVFNYSSLLGEGNALDNAGAMLIKLLKRANVGKIYLAGFDGFDIDPSFNYAVDQYKKFLDYDTANFKNINISKQLRLALTGVNYEFITPTKYEI